MEKVDEVSAFNTRTSTMSDPAILELIATYTGLYTGISLLGYMYVPDPVIETVTGPVEGAEFYDQKTQFDAPLYIAPGNFPVNFPVGGGLSTEKSRVFSAFRVALHTENQRVKTSLPPPPANAANEWINYTTDRAGKVTWYHSKINDKIFAKYKFPVGKIPLRFPFAVETHSWPGPIFFNRDHKVIGTQRENVMRMITNKAEMLPGTGIAGVVCVGAICLTLIVRSAR